MEKALQIRLRIETDDKDPYEQARATSQLRDEIKALGENGVVLGAQDASVEGQRNIDPMIAGAVIVAVGPTVLTKFLEFLHAWVMRREGRTVKISIKTQKGDSIEIEVPYTMSSSDVKQWINTVQDNVSKGQILTA